MSEPIPESVAPADPTGSAPSPEPGEPGEFSRDYVEKLRRENARYRTQVRELEPHAARVAELEAATATETEKAVATARAEAEKATADKYTRLLVEAEARAVAAELKFRDPGDAVHLVDLSDIEAGEDGAVNRDVVRDALRAIADKKPYLTEQSPPASPEDAGIGVTGTGGGKDYGTFTVDDFDKELGFTNN